MSFRIALSGLNAASTDLNVTAHNIANVNTTGFKRSRAEFADVYATSTFGLSRNATGTGVRTANIAQQFGQGNIDFTDNSLDMAISGLGFFTLSQNGSFVYTRAGNFATDREGYVVAPNGARLQAYAPSIGGTGFDTGRLTDLRLSTADNPPAPTTRATIGSNLPANALPPPVAVFDPDDPNSYNHTTSVTVYDSLGVSHVATFYYVRDAGTPAVPTDSVASGAYTQAASGTATDAFQFRIDGNLVSDRLVGDATDANLDADIAAFVAGSGGLYTVTGSVAGGDLVISRTDGQDMTIATSFSDGIGSTAPAVGPTSGGTFAGAGFVGTHTGGTPAVPAPNAWTLHAYITDSTNAGNRTALGTINLQYSDAGALVSPGAPYIVNLPGAFTPGTGAAPINLSLDLSESSQYGERFSISRLVQDGYATGRLTGIEVSEEGIVFARYSNGQSTGLGQVAMTNFANPQALQKLGDTQWGETFESGNPIRGFAGSSSFGTLQSGALEASNVDLTEQLVNMITAQRNFQANAQMIQTSDQVTQTIINLR